MFSMQPVTVLPSATEMRDEAMGAVAQRATVPGECESEIEQRLWGLLGDHYQSQFFGFVGALAGDLAWLEG